MQTIQVGWRLDRDIVEQVQRLAQEEERSIGVVVRRLLREGLKGSLSSPPDGFPPHPIYVNNIPPPSLTPSPIPPKKLSIKPDDPDFLTFWQEYPRRIGKGAARKAWEKARARVGAEIILGGLRAAVWPSDASFIPHPSTWLNQGRWDDEAPDNSVQARVARVMAAPTIFDMED